MQIVLHAGAHATDEDRLLKCLVANRDMLTARGTGVPYPKLYRKLLRDVLHDAAQDGVAPGAREALLGALGMEAAPDRLVLSNPGFFGTPKMAVSGGAFYTAAATRMRIFREIFAGDEVEMFFAICNPAMFLPAIMAQTRFDTLAELLGGTDPADMRWSDMIERVRRANPDVPVTVWCNEDTPLIWGQILREMAGVDHGVRMIGEHALLREIMTPAGMTRFEAYLARYPDMPEMQKRCAVAAFLGKFADEDAIEEELDLPGWTHEVVDRLTDLYDEDVDRIDRIPGVTLIAP